MEMLSQFVSRDRSLLWRSRVFRFTPVNKCVPITSHKSRISQPPYRITSSWLDYLPNRLKIMTWNNTWSSGPSKVTSEFRSDDEQPSTRRVTWFWGIVKSSRFTFVWWDSCDVLSILISGPRWSETNCAWPPYIGPNVTEELKKLKRWKREILFWEGVCV